MPGGVDPPYEGIGTEYHPRTIPAILRGRKRITVRSGSRGNQRDHQQQEEQQQQQQQQPYCVRVEKEYAIPERNANRTMSIRDVAALSGVAIPPPAPLPVVAAPRQPPPAARTRRHPPSHGPRASSGPYQRPASGTPAAVHVASRRRSTSGASGSKRLGRENTRTAATTTATTATTTTTTAASSKELPERQTQYGFSYERTNPSPSKAASSLPATRRYNRYRGSPPKTLTPSCFSSAQHPRSPQRRSISSSSAVAPPPTTTITRSRRPLDEFYRKIRNREKPTSPPPESTVLWLGQSRPRRRSISPPLRLNPLPLPPPLDVGIEAHRRNHRERSPKFVSPVRGLSPRRVGSPVHGLFLRKTVSPARRLSFSGIASPVRGLCSHKTTSPVPQCSPSRWGQQASSTHPPVHRPQRVVSESPRAKVRISSHPILQASPAAVIAPSSAFVSSSASVDRSLKAKTIIASANDDFQSQPLLDRPQIPILNPQIFPAVHKTIRNPLHQQARCASNPQLRLLPSSQQQQGTEEEYDSQDSDIQVFCRRSRKQIRCATDPETAAAAAAVVSQRESQRIGVELHPQSRHRSNNIDMGGPSNRNNAIIRRMSRGLARSDEGVDIVDSIGDEDTDGDIYHSTDDLYASSLAANGGGNDGAATRKDSAARYKRQNLLGEHSDSDPEKIILTTEPSSKTTTNNNNPQKSSRRNNKKTRAQIAKETAKKAKKTQPGAELEALFRRDNAGVGMSQDAILKALVSAAMILPASPGECGVGSDEAAIEADRKNLKSCVYALSCEKKIVKVTHKEEIVDEEAEGSSVVAGEEAAAAAVEQIDGMEWVRPGQINRIGVVKKWRDVVKEKTMWRVSGMVTPLLDYQVIGVRWMLDRELIHDNPKGGLVADAMGLGKTMQCIAAIALNPPPSSHTVDEPRVTLIVAPVALLQQWAQEISKHSKKDFFDVFVHNSHNRLKTVEELKEKEIVIASYGSIMHSYPPAIRPKKGMSEAEFDEIYNKAWDETRGIFHRIKFWRIILDESHIVKNKYTRTSLACQHLEAVHPWALSGTPFLNGLEDVFPIFRFLRHPQAGVLVNFRNLIGGNQVAAAKKVHALLRGCMLRRAKEDLFMGKPLIVLPAKRIKMVELAFSPEEQRLYSTVERICRDKINDYLQNGKDMSNYAWFFLMLSRLRLLCDHPFFIVKSIRKDFTIDDIDKALLAEEREEEDVEEEGAGTGGSHETTPPPPRRSKRLRTDDNVEEDDDEELPEMEMRDWDNRYNSGTIASAASTTSVAEPPPPRPRPPLSGLQQFLHQLRKQAVDGVGECEICNQEFDEEMVMTRCKHIFCRECIETAIDDASVLGKSYNCPTCCTRPVLLTDLKTYTPTIASDDWLSSVQNLTHSTKTAALLSQLRDWRTSHPTDKVVIFSQFVCMLDIIEKLCTLTEKWVTTRYQGSQPLTERELSLQKFRTNPDCWIMLTSLKAGGMGLNLTHANLVISVDLWWNVAIESQAFDRVHRLGQRKEVFVTRFIIRGTVEERILKMQKEKQKLVNMALGEGTGRLGKLTVRELMGLFGKVVEMENGGLELRKGYGDTTGAGANSGARG